MRRPAPSPVIGPALARGDVRGAFRAVRSELRRAMSTLRKQRGGFVPGHQAIAFGRALDAIGQREPEAMRRALPLAHEALRTLQARQPRQPRTGARRAR